VCRHLRQTKMSSVCVYMVCLRSSHMSAVNEVNMLCVAVNYQVTASGVDWHPALRMYRGMFLVILCIFLLGINTYAWRSSGVNHVLVFELDPRHHLNHQQLLEVLMLHEMMCCVNVCAQTYLLLSLKWPVMWQVGCKTHSAAVVTWLSVALHSQLSQMTCSQSLTCETGEVWQVC